MVYQAPGGIASRLRSLSSAVLAVLLPLSFTFIIFETLCLVTNSRVPIVCVTSESMAPTFHRGDVLLLWNRTSTVEVGDIPVVWFEQRPLPMVHRVIRVHSVTESEYVQQDHPSMNPRLYVLIVNFTRQRFLTKGDNNINDDVALYPEGRTLVARSEVIGFVRGFVPKLGWVVIAIQDNAYWAKPAIAAVSILLLVIG